MAVKHVFRPVRPLFSANINVRSDEQVKLEQLRNEQSQLSIDSLKETMIRNKAIWENDQAFKKEISEAMDDDTLTAGEQSVKLHEIAINRKPELGIKMLQQNEKEINDAISSVDVTTPDMRKVIGLDYSRAIKGDVDAKSSILAQVSKAQAKRNAGVGSYRETDFDKLEDNLEQLDLYKDALLNDPDVLPDEKAIISRLQNDEQTMKILRKYQKKHKFKRLGTLMRVGGTGADFTATSQEIAREGLTKAKTVRTIQEIEKDALRNRGYLSPNQRVETARIYEVPDNVTDRLGELKSTIQDLNSGEKYFKEPFFGDKDIFAGFESYITTYMNDVESGKISGDKNMIRLISMYINLRSGNIGEYINVWEEQLQGIVKKANPKSSNMTKEEIEEWNKKMGKR